LRRGASDVMIVETTIDPITKKKTEKRVPILTRNQRKGETVASARVVKEIMREFE